MSLELLTKQSSARENNGPQKKKISKTLPSWLIPLIILLGFAGTFTIVLWDDLKPSVKVQTARAIAVADAQQATPAKNNAQAPARLLFQAAGWLEPEPLATKAGSLINGTVKDVFVTEGQLVKKGDLLATLDDREYKIAVDRTHAAHMETAATIKLREAELKTAEAQIKNEEASLGASRERVTRAEISYNRYKNLKPDTVSQQTITDAKQELLELEKITLSNEAKVMAAKTALEEGKARLESAIAAEKNAEQACKKAELDLSRCKISAPINGRILRLSTTPGQQVSAVSDNVESALIATLYDPESIALKMDVPLDQAGKLSVDQQAKLRCEVFPDRVFTGKVTRIAGEADIQRNTLQARVRLTDPDDMLRPGMACRAEIYSPGVMPKEGETPVVDGETVEGQAVLIPANAIMGGNGQDAAVWTITVDGKLARKAVKRDSSKDKDGMIGISSGILPGEPVVLNPEADLREGDSAVSTK